MVNAWTSPLIPITHLKDTLMLDMGNALLRSYAPKVSACMIVKNEANNLRMSLPSFVHEVDELIIVDTGSTDETVEVAEQYGAKVYHFEWCDDFSAARNFSLEKATGDWIVWFDADEALTQIKDGGIRHLAQIAPVDLDGYLWKCNSQVNEYDTFYSWQWRMFPNYRGIKFTMALHESPQLPEMRDVRATEQFQCSTAHWGYLNQPPEVVKQKAERNGKILATRLMDAPDDYLMRFYLAKEMHAAGKPKESRRENIRAIRDWKAAGSPVCGGYFVNSLYSNLVRDCYTLKRYTEGMKWVADCPEFAGSTELCFFTGLCCMNLGRAKDAASAMYRAWSDPLLYSDDRSTATWRPLLMMSSIYGAQGMHDLSRGCLYKAMLVSPNNPAIAEYIAGTEGAIARAEQAA